MSRVRRFDLPRLAGALALTLVVGTIVISAIGYAIGYRPVVITTGSMGDTAPPGSLVIARPVAAEAVAAGDVLIMQRPDAATVTHRVIVIDSIDGQLLATTKGDANAHDDPGTYSLEGTELVAAQILPRAGSAITAFNSPMALVGVFALIVGAVMFVALRALWRDGNPAERPTPAPAGTPRSPRRRWTTAGGVALVALVIATVAIALFRQTEVVATNTFSTADCFQAQVAGVQKGNLVHALNGTETVTVGAVDPARSFLLFSTRSVGDEPADATIIGTVVDGTTIQFARTTDAGPVPPIVIEWSLITYNCGVTVERGLTSGNGLAVLDIPIASVDPSASFVVWSSAGPSSGTSTDADDQQLAELADATTLRFRTRAPATLPSSHRYAWQVVQFADPDDVRVQVIDINLGATDTVAAASIPLPVVPANTMLLAGSATASTSSDIGDRMARVELTSATGVRVERDHATDPMDLSIQVVELADGTTVRHGIVDLAPGESMATAPIDAVDPAVATGLSTVQSAGGASLGMTAHASDDILGEAAATFEVTTATEVTVARASSTSAAGFAWQVVEWGGPGWWDPAYDFRQRIDVTAGSAAAPSDYSVPLPVDHAQMVAAGTARADGDDLRVVRWDGASWVELDRVLDDGSTWDRADTTLWFRTRDPVAAAGRVSYWLYYGNTAPLPPPADPEGVWLLHEDFESGTLGDFVDRTGATSWYQPSPWTRRRVLSVQAGMVPSDVTDFPVLVDLTDSAMGAEAQADGDDIRFLAGDAITPLLHEIELWDPGTGRLVAWVKLPAVAASTNTPFYLYYGAPDAPDQQETAAVWTGGFTSVWHMADDPAGTAPQADDSASGANDGLSEGTMTGASLVSGPAGPAVRFDGVDDRMAVGSFDVDLRSAITVSGWVRVDSLGAEQLLLSKANGPADRVLDLSVTAAGAAQTHLRIGGTTHQVSGGAVGAGVWHHVAATWDGTTIRLHVDGAEVASTPAAGQLDLDPTMPVTIGDQLGGRVDEVRLSTLARSADWLATSRGNQLDPASFVSVGTVETGSWLTAGAWTYRKPIVVDADRIAETASDYPLLVEVTDPDLQAASRADGADLVFTDADGVTRLDHEIEEWNPATGSLTAWVRVPTVGAVVDTQLFVYYGNPSAADQQDPGGVFGPETDGVWHLEPSGP